MGSISNKPPVWLHPGSWELFSAFSILHCNHLHRVRPKHLTENEGHACQALHLCALAPGRILVTELQFQLREDVPAPALLLSSLRLLTTVCMHRRKPRTLTSHTIHLQGLSVHSELTPWLAQVNLRHSHKMQKVTHFHTFPKNQVLSWVGFVAQKEIRCSLALSPHSGISMHLPILDIS